MSPLLARPRASKVARWSVPRVGPLRAGFSVFGNLPDWRKSPPRSPSIPASGVFALCLPVRQSTAMGSVRKPVIVRKFSRDWFAGYARTDFGQDAAELEILDPAG